MKNGSSLDTRQPELVLFWYNLGVCVCMWGGGGGGRGKELAV